MEFSCGDRPGPDQTEIQQRKTQSTRQVEIRESNDPGKDRLKKDRLELFKPEVQRQVPGGRSVVPDRRLSEFLSPDVDAYCRI